MQNKIPSSLEKKVNTISKIGASAVTPQSSSNIVKNVASITRSTATTMKSSVLNAPKQVASVTRNTSSVVKNSIANAPKQVASGIHSTKLPNPTKINPSSKPVMTATRIVTREVVRQSRKNHTSYPLNESRGRTALHSEGKNSVNTQSSGMAGVLFIVVVVLGLLALLTGSFVLGIFAVTVAVLSVKLSRKPLSSEQEELGVTDDPTNNSENHVYGEYGCVNCGAKNMGSLPLKCEYCGTDITQQI